MHLPSCRNNSFAIRDLNAGTVDARPQALLLQLGKPPAKISKLLGQQPPSLLLVDKNHHAGRKALALGRSDGKVSVRAAQSGSVFSL